MDEKIAIQHLIDWAKERDDIQERCARYLRSVQALEPGTTASTRPGVVESSHRPRLI